MPTNPPVNELWQDMPEFVQDKIKPYAELTLRFRSEEDMREFAKMTSQTITNKTKSAWFPKLIRGETAHLRFIDEE